MCEIRNQQSQRHHIENDAKTCVRVALFQEKRKARARETHVKVCHAQNTKNGKDGKDKQYLNILHA